MPCVDQDHVGVVLQRSGDAPPASAVVAEPVGEDHRRSIGPARSIHVETDRARLDIGLDPPSGDLVCWLTHRLVHQAYASGAGPGPGKISSSRRSTSSGRVIVGARSASSSCSMVRGPMMGAVTAG